MFWRFIALVSYLSLSGCALIGSSAYNVAGVPTRHELFDVPFFPQRKNQCGAAALATVLNYRGRPVSSAELEPLLFIPRKGGTLSVEIVAQARQRGLLVYPLAANQDDLVRELAAGNPVLVLQNLGLKWFPQWHFAVVVGYDLARQTLILRSGVRQRKEVALRAFMNTWARADNWAVVIVPPGKLPATATPMPAMQAAAELEQFVPEAAGDAYQAMLEKWPQDKHVESLARLGLSNIAYQQGEYFQAKKWLLSGHGLTSSAMWNNLGYTLRALGCPAASLQAAECAVSLGPDNEAFQASYRELQKKVAETAVPDAEHSGRGETVLPAVTNRCEIPRCDLP